VLDLLLYVAILILKKGEDVVDEVTMVFRLLKAYVLPSDDMVNLHFRD
jgi:hypothetical protein